MKSDPSDRAPVSLKHLGDRGPWTWELPRLWRMLADPEGPTRPPRRPWTTRTDAGLSNRHIAYWAPLLTLTFGVLGWTRPAVGIHRWIEAGRPADDPPIAALARWWGDDAQALVAWSHHAPSLRELSKTIALRTGTELGPDTPANDDANRTLHPYFFAGGGDPMHLAWHAEVQLTGWFPQDGPLPRILHDPPDGPHRAASLVLPSYGGWYTQLAHAGASLPQRQDGRSWRVHVTVPAVGYLGAYRRSRISGRWFAGRHQWHELGWTT